MIVYLSTPPGSHAQCSEFIASGRSCGLLSETSVADLVGCSRSVGSQVQPTSKVSELWVPTSGWLECRLSNICQMFEVYLQSRLRNSFQISCWCQKCVQLPDADTASVHSCKGFILPECFLGGKNYPSWTAACNVLLIDTSSKVLPSEKETGTC